MCRYIGTGTSPVCCPVNDLKRFVPWRDDQRPFAVYQPVAGQEITPCGRPIPWLATLMTSQTETSIPSTKGTHRHKHQGKPTIPVPRGEGTSSSRRLNGSIRRVHQILSMIKIQEYNGREKKPVLSTLHASDRYSARYSRRGEFQSTCRT